MHNLLMAKPTAIITHSSYMAPSYCSVVCGLVYSSTHYSDRNENPCAFSGHLCLSLPIKLKILVHVMSTCLSKFYHRLKSKRYIYILCLNICKISL